MARLLPMTLIALAASSLAADRARAADPAAGSIAPEIKLDGKPAAGACKWTAVPRAGGAEVESDDGAAKDAPAGAYELRATCGTGDDAIATAGVAVTVKPGKKEAPRLDLKRTRLRVMAKREGNTIPASVRVLPAGADPASAPLAERPANAKFTVAAGTYDLFVRANAPAAGGITPEVRLKSVRAQGDGVTAMDVDLSEGALIVALTENGKPASGGVRVFAGTGTNEVAQTSAGNEVRLAPGRYTVAATLESAADFGVRKAEVWVEPGKLAKPAIRFETGTLAVAVTQDGKPFDATVRLAFPGAADFFNFFPAPGEATLAPGKYDVTVESDRSGSMKSQSKKGVEVKARGASKLAFDFTPATVALKLTQGGAKLDPVDVKLRAPGGGDDVARPDASGVFRVWPGRYELAIALADGEEMVDGPFEVKLAEKVVRNVAVTRGAMVVVPMRGREIEPEAEVQVFRPGAAKPVAKARAQAVISLPPGVYDVKVTAGPETAWSEGVKVKEGKPTQVKVAMKARPHSGPTLPEGDLGPLPDGEDELPEGEGTPDAGPRTGGDAARPGDAAPGTKAGDAAPAARSPDAAAGARSPDAGPRRD